MNCSTPGLAVLHYLLEFAQTHVHWYSDVVQPSHSLLLPFSFCLQSLSASGSLQWVISSHQVVKVWTVLTKSHCCYCTQHMWGQRPDHHHYCSRNKTKQTPQWLCLSEKSLVCCLLMYVHCHVLSLTHRILTKVSGKCDHHFLPPGSQGAGGKGVGVLWGMVFTAGWFHPSSLLDNVWRYFSLSQLRWEWK